MGNHSEVGTVNDLSGSGTLGEIQAALGRLLE